MTAQRPMIVYDWNGTLLEDAHIMLYALNIARRRFSKPDIDMETMRAAMDVPFTKLYQNIGFSEDEIAAIVAANNDIFHDYYEPEVEKTTLREGAHDLLALAHKHSIPQFILSNHLAPKISGHLTRYGALQYFTEILAYADRATQFKDMTKGERLRRYMAANDIKPSEAFIIGDTIEETHIARDLGLVSIAMTGGFASEERLRAINPDYLIHSLREVPDILRERGLIA